jgi:hypothetical protein
LKLFYPKVSGEVSTPWWEFPWKKPFSRTQLSTMRNLLLRRLSSVNISTTTPYGNDVSEEDYATYLKTNKTSRVSLVEATISLIS